MKGLAICGVLFLAFFSYGANITTLDGHTYINVNVRRTDPIGIFILHSAGGCYIAFTNLPETVRDAYHYNPAVAAEHVAVQQAAFVERQLVAQKQSDSEKARRAITCTKQIVKKEKSSAMQSVEAESHLTPTSCRQHEYTTVDYSTRSYSSGRVYVRGYTRKDGTYVRPYTRRR